MITTEAKGSTYFGIKRLWQTEVQEWLRDLSKATYSIYLLPNTNYNTQEYWVVFSESDLPTLKQYLIDVKRVQDFENKKKILNN